MPSYFCYNQSTGRIVYAGPFGFARLRMRFFPGGDDVLKLKRRKHVLEKSDDTVGARKVSATSSDCVIYSLRHLLSADKCQAHFLALFVKFSQTYWMESFFFFNMTLKCLYLNLV